MSDAYTPKSGQKLASELRKSWDGFAAVYRDVQTIWALPDRAEAESRELTDEEAAEWAGALSRLKIQPDADPEVFLAAVETAVHRFMDACDALIPAAAYFGHSTAPFSKVPFVIKLDSAGILGAHTLDDVIRVLSNLTGHAPLLDDALLAFEADMQRRLDAAGAGAEAQAAAEAVDKNGLVTNPTDPTAYSPASKIIATNADIAPNPKALNKVLDKNPAIQRWKPSKNRLYVHLGDWSQHIASAGQRDEWADDKQGVAQRTAQIRQAKNRDLRK